MGEVTEDLVVETTLDLPIQAAAEVAVRQGVQGHTDQGVGQGALVAMDGEGRIRAYVGGAVYADSQFDRATTAKRQAGSSFKPFVYLAAMEAGRKPSDTIVDEPLTIGKWSPRNYSGGYMGTITLQTALAQSVNTVAARLADEVGTGAVAEAAHRLGITSKIQTDPSMALGAVEVSPLEMAQAYDAFANGGFRVKGYGIERIRTATGRVLQDHAAVPAQKVTVVNPPALPFMIQMMRQVVTGGTGTRARVAGYDLAGKTGTTSDYRDAWFVGYTGGFAAAVWVGRDDNTPMRKVTGGGVPAEIWHNFMAAALPRLQAQTIPMGVSEAPDAIGDIIDQNAETDPDRPTDAPPPPEEGDTRPTDEPPRR